MNLFGDNVYRLGLPEEFAHLLQKAEQAMSSLDQPRETATIATWRSETFKALGKTEECKKMRNEQIQGMKDTLFQDLSKTLPILFTRRETSIRFYLQVLVPAAKLATTIQTSASKYAFTFQKSLSIQFKPLTPSWFKIHKIIDIKTGKYLKPDSAKVPDEQGSFVINSEPGLCRVNKDSQEVVLRPTTLLVELKYPLGKRNKTCA